MIRAATPADQALISQMQHEAFFAPPGAEPFPRTILDEPQIRKYHANSGTGDVGSIAESSVGEPLGAAWARRVEGYGFVDDETPEPGIAVARRARCAGIGAALIEPVVEVASRRSRGVDARNRAMRLDERLGFTAVRLDGDRAAVMLRSPS